MENCSLCEKGINKSYSLEFAGMMLAPLCGDCKTLGIASPKKLVAEHRVAFEKIAANHKASLPSHEVDIEAARSKRERSVVSRYIDAYFLGKAVVAFGTVLKITGIFLGLLIATGAFVISSQETSNLSGSIVIAGLVVGAVVGLCFYALGVIIAGLGQLVRGILDCAVNTSPFLGDNARSRVMSLD